MKLFKHQIEGVDFMAGVHGGVLLADEPGLGKTAQVATLIKQQNLLPALVICPASVKDNWKREIKMWTGYDAQILSGKSPEGMDQPPPITIINYDILDAWKMVLAGIRWGCLAIDECHMLADRASKRTRATKLISRHALKVIGISGTPVLNRPADFWPILNIIRPDMFKSFPEYAWAYCDPRKTPWGWEYKGAKNLDRLHQTLQTFMIRRKKDVMDLPDKSRVIVPMTVDEPETLQSAENDFIGWLTSNSRYGNVTSAKKAEAVTKLGVILRLTSRLKCRSVVRWARQFLADNPNEKLVLFAVHRDMIDVLKRRVHPEGVVVIDGSVPTSKRQAIVDSFQNDPKVRLMVANVKAAGVGITLTAASTIGVAELWWTSATMAQAEDRIHRVTQDKACTIHYLVVPGTVEQKICNAVQTKQQIADAVIDGHRVTSMPILDLLLSSSKGLMKNVKKTV
jgi:SWI/SNF-related matrix-associated actin-dependent regulator 1 of chromatin subfamily A